MSMLEFEFVIGSSTILSLDHIDVRARKEWMVYFKQAREYILLEKKNRILALPRWIAGNHIFYFGKTCLFQDGGGDDKQMMKSVWKDWKKIKNRTIDETFWETARFRMGNRLHDVQQRPTTT